MLRRHASEGAVVTPHLLLSFLLCFSCHRVHAQQHEEEGDLVATIADIQRLGEANVENATRRYIASGVDQEQTLRENTEAFTRFRLRCQVRVDLSRVNTATTVLGRRISIPIGLSPSATHMMAHPVGELGTVKAARDAGTAMIVSAMSTATLEDIRASAPDTVLWQQTYLFKNRSLTESLVRRAAIQDFGAIVVTVDSPISGQASILTKTNFRLSKGLSFANLEASMPGRSLTYDPASADSIGNLHSPSATWEDIRWLRHVSGLPIVVKGVLTAESALTALKYGAAAVLVSNHGGRILDGVPATIEALPEIVAAVGDRMEIYLDGGVRSGADVTKALSLGARAVFLGRPVLWGLAYNGKEGVDEVLHIFKNELERTLQDLGCRDSDDLCTEYIAAEGRYSEPLPSTCKPKRSHVRLH